MAATQITFCSLGYRTQVESDDGTIIGSLNFGDMWTRYRSANGHELGKWFTNAMRESDETVLREVNALISAA